MEHKTKLHEALHVLKAARDYLTDPEHWIKGKVGDRLDVNEGTSHADLLGVWDLAIEECQKRIREYEAGLEIESHHD